ncbi:MAG: hypothetical protein AB8B48_13030 [Pseudomonadales bacterium]
MEHTSFFSRLFLAAALWNFSGAVLGYFNTAFAFEMFFNRELTDPLMFSIYKGAWGTTLTYFIGYLLVSRNPAKHYGIAITGGIGKLGFIISLLQLYTDGIASPIVFIVIIGDAIFLLLFAYYFYQLYSSREVLSSQAEV